MKHNYAGAGWLKQNLDAINKREAAKKPRKVKGKVREPKPPRLLSEFGARVANILGFVYRGIYHIETDNTDWGDDSRVEITLHYRLSTYDSYELTELVVLCHDQKIRLELEAGGPRRIKLCFSPRSSRDGDIYDRHPTIEAAIERIRKASGSEVLP